jgi:hypothetical protein
VGLGRRNIDRLRVDMQRKRERAAGLLAALDRRGDATPAQQKKTVDYRVGPSTGICEKRSPSCRRRSWSGTARRRKI